MAHQWPQIDERSIMEKPNHQPQQQQQLLKCPRCDSSNTKFCYYNNYSLSQPRHFCKACKRYWTRGGTLRNVPVGGGCRKNKRIRRPTSSASADGGGGITTNPNPNPNPNPNSQSQFDVTNPLFYGSSEMNIPFSRVLNVDSVSGYDFQPQLNSLGLGFSSGIMSDSNSLFSNYSMFNSSSCSSTTTPTIASLLASSFQGLKDTQNPNQFQSIEVKTEGGQTRMDWNHQIEQIGLSDPSLYWNAPAAGAWHDPANIGSSVTSLF